MTLRTSLAFACSAAVSAALAFACNDDPTRATDAPDAARPDVTTTPGVSPPPPPAIDSGGGDDAGSDAASAHDAGSAAGDVFVVGDMGTVLHRDGSGAWKPEASGTTTFLVSVWGSSAGDVYAVGVGGTIVRRR